MNSSVSEISLAGPRSGRDNLIRSAKTLFNPRKQSRNRPIPTLASNSKLHFRNGLQIPEEASASESASEINTGIRLNNYSGITRQSLATTGFAARLV